MATATLWGHYTYEFEMPKNPTLHKVAWAISLAVHEAEGRTKFTGTPRTYNYVLEALKENPGTFNFMRYNGDSDKVEEIYRAANELQNESKFRKVKCDDCNGKGYAKLQNCPECNGYGHVWNRISWRVGTTFDFAIAIDIDDPGEENLLAVREYYSNLLEMNFRTFKTGGGYWLIGDKLIESKGEFRDYHCKILNPELKSWERDDYVEGLLALDKGKEDNFVPATPDVIKSSEYYKAPADLNFDVAFTFLSIKREQSTLRQSAKFPGDKIIEIK